MASFTAKIRYPKLLLLLLTFVLAYFIFSERNFSPLHGFLLSLGYFGAFLAGIFYVYSFTAAPATIFLLILAGNKNIYLTGLYASLGALLGDLFLFKLLRHSFKEELNKLPNEKTITFFKKLIPQNARRFLAPVIATIFFVTPLPDELGILLLASTKTVTTKIFIYLSLGLNIVGIFIILFIGAYLK